MGAYAEAAELYDILYADAKDYAAEARLVAQIVRERCPDARTLLDVGCGTGAHARGLIDLGFHVDGVDIEPAFVRIASEKCPEGTFSQGDMTTFELAERYDGVLCLFSAIGYVRDEAGLDRAIGRMASHLSPGGVVVVDPWFGPGELSHGRVSTLVGERDGVTVCRMSRTLVEGNVSRLEFEYLIGTAGGLERAREVHELGLFDEERMERAFATAGLEVERHERALRTRGIYVGVAPS